MAIASLVIGVVFWVVVFLPLPIIYRFDRIMVTPVCVAGLILGILAYRRKSRRKVAIAGIVLNLIPVLFIVAAITLWAILGDRWLFG